MRTTTIQPIANNKRNKNLIMLSTSLDPCACCVCEYFLLALIDCKDKEKIYM